MGSKMRNRRGIALAEFICSIAVLTIVMMANAMVIGRSLTHSNLVRHRVIANRILASEADRVRATGYDSLDIRSGQDITRDNAEFAKLEMPKLTMTVTEYDTARPGLKKVEMTISWGAERKKYEKRTVFMIAKRADGT